MDIYITNEGDGLLFDKKHKNILNDLEDPKAPPIETYTINLRRLIKNEKIKSVERSNYINKRYKEYLSSTFKFDNDKTQSIFEKN